MKHVAIIPQGRSIHSSTSGWQLVHSSNHPGPPLYNQARQLCMQKHETWPKHRLMFWSLLMAKSSSYFKPICLLMGVEYALKKLALKIKIKNNNRKMFYFCWSEIFEKKTLQCLLNCNIEFILQLRCRLLTNVKLYKKMT